MKKLLIFLIVLVLIIIVGAVFYYNYFPKLVSDKPVACTMEAKLCPDGVTSVGRQGPNCEFAECPIIEVENGVVDWETYRNDKYGFQFMYPKEWKVETGVVAPSIFKIAEHPDWGGASGGVAAWATEKMTVEKALVELRRRANKVTNDVKAIKYGVPEIITIDGVTAIKQSYQPYEIVPSGIEYQFPEKGFVFFLTDLYTDNEPIEVASSEVQKKVLSTFKFTK